MKIPFAMLNVDDQKVVPAGKLAGRRAFTLVEIAICIAIISIALVGIIAVLPLGMNAQRDTREETIISQDAATLLPIITRGARDDDDLTNYVYAITNYRTLYKSDGVTIVGSGAEALGYTYTSSPPSSVIAPYSTAFLTNGAIITGLLSTPEFIANIKGASAYHVVPSAFNSADLEVYSNHVIAYVHSISGLATEKPPQDNGIVIGDAFSYRLLVVNAPIALDTNTTDPSLNNSFYSLYNHRISQNQRECRLTFYWPLLPNGNIGNEPPLTYRATVAGQLTGTNVDYDGQPEWYYFYQPQLFIVNTNQP